MQEYETIKQARAILEEVKGPAPSERTTKGYLAKAKRIIAIAKIKGNEIEASIAEVKNTRSANTCASRRAAMLWVVRDAMKQLLKDQDSMQRVIREASAAGQPADLIPWRDAIFRIGRLITWHNRLQEEGKLPISGRRRRHSKRQDMKGLPEDWWEKMVDRLPKYRLAVLTQAVTGCRPDELAKGVKLSISGDQLVVEIIGSKVSEKSGQPIRRLKWDLDSKVDLVQKLIAMTADGATEARIANPKAYSSAVRAAGEREWPKRKNTVTPYCFRHAAASDMKGSGMLDVNISAALGHCVSDTKEFYGQRQQGRKGGGVAPKSVETERPVKVVAQPTTALPRINHAAEQEWEAPAQSV